MEAIFTIENLMKIAIIAIFGLFATRLYKLVERYFLYFLKKVFNISVQKRIKLKWEYARKIVEDSKSEFSIINLKIRTLAYFVGLSNLIIGTGLYILIAYTNSDLDSQMNIGMGPITFREDIERVKSLFPLIVLFAGFAFADLQKKYTLSINHFQKKLKRRRKLLRKTK